MAKAKIYISEENLNLLLDDVKRRQAVNHKAKGVEIILFFQDETNKYGQNITAILSKTREEREADPEPVYIGNGAVMESGKIFKADKVKKSETINN